MMNKDDLKIYWTAWILKFLSTGKFKLFIDGVLSKSGIYSHDVNLKFNEWIENKAGNISIVDDGFMIEFASGKKHSFKIERDFSSDKSGGHNLNYFLFILLWTTALMMVCVMIYILFNPTGGI